jgi:uncharacterized UPF0146 family protein
MYSASQRSVQTSISPVPEPKKFTLELSNKIGLSCLLKTLHSEKLEPQLTAFAKVLHDLLYKLCEGFFGNHEVGARLC